MVDARTTIDTKQSLRTGILIGLAGGAAEFGVVWGYAATTGTDAAAVARGVAASFGFDPAAATSVGLGIAIHMLLAAGLGVALYSVVQRVPARARSYGAVPFMLGSLAAVWAVNFFVVLPMVNPAFVHLLPYGVTLASKLAFGATAAFMLGHRQRVSTPTRKVAVLAPAR